MKRPRPVGKAPQTQFTAKGIAARLVNLNLGRDEDEIFRMVRHYSNHGLIDTVGAVHTGSGRSRVYSDEAMLLAGILFRLNRLGVPVGVMKELLSGLRVHLKNEHQGKGLMVVARAMEDPCLFLVIPDKIRTVIDAPRLLERGSLRTLPPDRDIVMIQLKRFLS